MLEVEKAMNEGNQKMHPIHPGELLREILEELDISAYALAKRIGKAPIQVSRILAGKSSVTAPMARLIGAALDTTAQYWVNLQAHYDLEVAKQEVPLLTVKPLVIDGKRVNTPGIARH
jgi:addiction module HigA family antidote